MYFHDDDTIVAVSSPAGNAAHGIIRLSGKDAVRIASEMLCDGGPLTSGRNYFHFFDDIDLGEPLGAVPSSVYVMRAPTSYTREDIVEFHTFGSPPILHALLRELLSKGGRTAQPGEFTKRAFLNGRIDLTQAEAVLWLIKSQSSSQRRAALAQLSGELSRDFEEVRSELVSLLALMEVGIDFSDQEIEIVSVEELEAELRELIGKLSALLSAVAARTVFKEEILVVIVGRPNVGKSSLFNALLDRNRAMTSSVPGTTRDTVEEVVNLHGVRARLVDTAGVTEGLKGVSAEAANRSLAALEAAELAIFVADSSQSLMDQDWQLASRLSAPAVVAANKSDLRREADEQELRRLIPSAPVVSVSALRGTGLKELSEAIVSAIRSGEVGRDASRFALTAEQHNRLRNVLMLLHGAARAAKEGLSEEFIALDLREAVAILGCVTGRSAIDSILDEIFSRFCIGK